MLVLPLHKHIEIETPGLLQKCVLWSSARRSHSMPNWLPRTRALQFLIFLTWMHCRPMPNPESESQRVVPASQSHIICRCINADRISVSMTWPFSGTHCRDSATQGPVYLFDPNKHWLDTYIMRICTPLSQQKLYNHLSVHQLSIFQFQIKHRPRTTGTWPYRSKSMLCSESSCDIFQSWFFQPS